MIRLTRAANLMGRLLPAGASVSLAPEVEERMLASGSAKRVSAGAEGRADALAQMNKLRHRAAELGIGSKGLKMDELAAAIAAAEGKSEPPKARESEESEGGEGTESARPAGFGRPPHG